MQSITPYEWQEPLIDKIVASLTTNRFLINGCPTGSGKTVLALAAAMRLNSRLLCVVPKVSVTQWIRTAEAMGCKDLLLDVVTAQSLVMSKRCPYYTKTGTKGKPSVGQWHIPKGLLISWDEPHRTASGEDSQSTYAMAALKSYGAKLHAMSATIADSPKKLRGAGYWGGLHGFYDASFFAWCRANGCKDERIPLYDPKTGGYTYRNVLQFTRDPKEGRAWMEKIRGDFGSQFLSMKAEDIPGFPEMSLDVVLLDLDKRDRAEINAAVSEMSERIRHQAKSQLAERGREMERVEHTMAAALAELAARSVWDGNSAVVGFHHTEPRERFTAELAKLGITNVSSVYGTDSAGRPQRDRQASVDLFQDNVNHVMAVAVQAGGAALSLHDARHERMRESFFIPGDDASAVKQFLGRIRRCNGTFARQHLILAAGTIHERVATNLNRKISNIDAFNEALCDADLIP